MNQDIPERPLVNEGDFLDPDNDYVATSRLERLVDLSGAIPICGSLLGQRRIRNAGEAADVWDSDKDDVGNAGIVISPVINDSERW